MSDEETNKKPLESDKDPKLKGDNSPAQDLSSTLWLEDMPKGANRSPSFSEASKVAKAPSHQKCLIEGNDPHDPHKNDRKEFSASDNGLDSMMKHWISKDAPAKLVHDVSGVKVEDDKNAPLEAAAIKNTKDVLINAESSLEDKLRAAQVLAKNGITAFDGADGTKFQIQSSSIEGQEQVSVSSVRPDSQLPEEITGTLNDKGEVLQSSKVVPDANSEVKPNVEPVPEVENKLSPKSGEVGSIFDPTLTDEQKLQEADRMFKQGERKFVGADGRQYETVEAGVGDRKVVSIFTQDKRGNTQAVLRGILEQDGTIARQQDDQYKEVDLQSNWAKKHSKDISLLDRDLEKQKQAELEKQKQAELEKQKQAELEKQKQGELEKQKQAELEKQKQAELEKQKQAELEKQKQEELEKQKQQPETASEHLRKSVSDKFQSDTDRTNFLNDMDDFEHRAKERKLSDKEVETTYQHVSRLLDEKTATVGEADRQLAAKTLMRQLGSPSQTDQGYHNTCNVTTLAERVATRNPSKAAEMVATLAISGSWTAPDGKVIKVASQDLTPGSEEKSGSRFPGGSRSYATQLMNLAMVNDSLQREMPAKYYGNGRPSATNRTGETVSYADGTPVGDGGYHGISTGEILAIGKRLTGESDFIIKTNEFSAGSGEVTVDSQERLGRTLKEMKEQNRLPAIVLVDANDTLFSGSGLNAASGKWHVVSVTDYDEGAQKVAISNQWGSSFDVKADLGDLFRSTRNKRS